MNDASPVNGPPRHGWRSAPRTLHFLSAAMPAIFILAGIAYWLFDLAPRDGWRVAVILIACACVGIALGAVLFASAALLSGLRDIGDALVRVERFQYESHSETNLDDRAGASQQLPNGGPDLADPPPQTVAQWQELLLLVRDIRDNSLLDDEELAAKKLRVREDEFRHARELLQSMIKTGDFASARQLARNLAAKFPDDPDAAAMSDEVEAAREKRESSDIAQCVKQVNDLINISAWQRARELAEQLGQRHPDSTEANQLLVRVDREYKVFQDQQRGRMYAEIQRYVSRRRWGEALAAAQTFVERFPTHEESEALRLQIPTLEANAEIEVRQQMEQEIMEMAKHGRYVEAVALAQRVIERYPTSPQADALRKQLPRLEELAHDPNAPPARIRIDD